MRTRLVPSPCPYCYRVSNSATEPAGEDVRPEPGDASLCFYCGEFNVFDEHLILRKPTDDEMIEIGMDKGAQFVRQAWVAFKEEKEQDAS